MEMTEGQATGPLQGLKVLDLATFVAAPFCGTLLAEFGADVVKVEMPGRGDSIRTLGEEKDGHGLLWAQEGRNKRTIACDLRTPEGKQIILDLVASGYETVLENFRPGTLERWGLGYDVLSQANSRVLLARVSAYGQTGPRSGFPGFGRTAHAFGGLTFLSGMPGEVPVNPGTATIADYVSGLFAAIGVLVAHVERINSGQGQVVDVALYESVLRILDSLTVSYAANGTVRGRSGTGTPLAAPHNHYETADGRYIAIACTNTRIFERLAGVMGMPGLAADPDFRTERDRVANREKIDGIVSSWVLTHNLDSLVEMLDAAEVPNSPINSVADIFENEHVRERGTLVEVEHEELGPLRMPAVVPRLSRTPGQIRHLGRALGADTDDMLANELGKSAEEIAELRSRGVIG